MLSCGYVICKGNFCSLFYLENSEMASDEDLGGGIRSHDSYPIALSRVFAAAVFLSPTYPA